MIERSRVGSGKNADGESEEVNWVGKGPRPLFFAVARHPATEADSWNLSVE